MTINTTKLANAVKFQSKTLTMNDVMNLRTFGTDFFHWAIVRKVKCELKREISMSEVSEWLNSQKAA